MLAAGAIVETLPDVLGGLPVIKGTRIPVHDVAASLAAGHSIERILAAYPGLDAEKIRLAGLYAEANPLSIWPHAAADALPTGAVIVADRRMPRDRS